MKFDAPATTNPIDQLKVVGKPTDRIDGPLKTTGTAPYAYDRHDVVPNQAYGFVVGSAIAKGRIASIDLSAAKAAAGVLAIVTADNAGKLGKGNYNTAKLLGGPEIDHYHQAIAVVVAETFEQARAAAQLLRVNYVRTEGKYDLAAVKDTGKPARITGGPPDTAVGDFDKRVRRGAGPARCHLHHARSGARDDGAACLDRRMGRRQAHALDLQPDDRLERGRYGKDAGHPQGECSAHFALHWWRLWRQAVYPGRCVAGGAGCARGQAAGEGGADAAADVQQYGPPAGDHPAHPHRRDPGWQDHCDRP